MNAKFEEEKLTKEQQLELLDQYFVSTDEALEILQISRQSFYSLINRKKIMRIKKGGAVLYLREDIMARMSVQGWLRKKYRPFDT
ncbi:helix-turn-helix domain-containing protein [Listeria aquatica]|uniref:helix-turn-helix domain-containing protein n=1 Tax=Listeria aquatica TaxID=1494960 RepID=UPI003F6F5FDE